jgi:hypothetical protein
MNTETKKDMMIYKQKLAGHLMKLGFVLLSITPNLNDPHKNVFFFRNSEELQQAIKEYNEN